MVILEVYIGSDNALTGFEWKEGSIVCLKITTLSLKVVINYTLIFKRFLIQQRLNWSNATVKVFLILQKNVYRPIK